MTSLRKTIQALSDRLPEILLYAQKRKVHATPTMYPRGLFRTHSLNINDYINEINADIYRLQRTHATASQAFQANQIKQKINVLVQSTMTQTPSPRHNELLSPLSQASYAEQVADVSRQINQLKKVEQQLQRTLERKQADENNDIVTAIQKAISETHEKITTAEQELHRLKQLPSWQR